MTTPFNVTSSSSALWRAARARQATGGAPVRLACFGDSITEGFSATGDHLTGPWSRKLLTLLSQSDVASNWTDGQEWFTAVAAGYPDPRSTFGTDWYISNGGDGPGIGGSLGTTTGITSAGEYTYGPVTCTEFVVWYRNWAAGGRFSYAIDSGAHGALIETDTAVTGKNPATDYYTALVVQAGSLGPHTLRLQAQNPASRTAVFLGIQWRDATTARAVLASNGRFGTHAAMWSGDSSLRDMYDYMTSDLSVIYLGTNDRGPIGAGAGVTPATYAMNLGLAVDRQRAKGGDVILVSTQPLPSPTWADVGPWATAVRNLATAKDVVVVDLAERWVDLATAISLGFLPSNDGHPTEAGHQDIAAAVMEAVNAMSAAGASTGNPTYRKLSGGALQAASTYRLVGGQIVANSIRRLA